jgi:uncharacterized protein DUF4149
MLRRFIVLVALAFWQGGFTFYAGIVVPVAMTILRPSSQQSFVTLAVTRYLNLAGAIALLILACDLALTPRSSPRLRARWLLWALMTLALSLLFWIHPRMVALMDIESQTLLDRDALWPLHKLYLWISSAQWLCATIFIILMLLAWRHEDRLEGSLRGE